MFLLLLLCVCLFLRKDKFPTIDSLKKNNHLAAAADFSLFFDSCYLPKGTPWIFSVLPKVPS